MFRSRLLSGLIAWLQRHAAADHNSITITITPAKAERAFQMDLPRWSLRLLGAILAAAFALILIGGVLYGKLIRDAVVLREVREENAVLRASAARLGEIEEEVRQLDRVRRQLYELAGVPQDSVFSDESSGTSSSRAIVAEAIPSEFQGSEDSRSIEGPVQYPPHLGPVSRGFTRVGARDPEHSGVDIAGKEGSPISAAAEGEVVFAGWDTTFGNMLVVRHSDGWETKYGHNQSLLVSHGDSVRAGQTIALLGSTGRSSAPHLHFEVLKAGAPVDPGEVFAFYRREPQGRIALPPEEVRR